MQLRGDDRAVTVQIGAVLLFAVLIVGMSTYQAVVVPEQNASAEYEHGQRVQADMVDLRNAILRTAATGASQPTAVALGTRYPERLVFVNPPPASGTLRTGPERTLVVSNASAVDPDARDHWNGDARAFSTRDLVYEPQYRGYDGAPATVFDGAVLYNRFDTGANVTLSEQSVVDGRRITLVTLAGTRATSGTGAASVDPRPLSPSTATVRTVTIGNASGPVTLTVPTRLPAATWDDLLASQTRVQGVAQNGSGAVDVVLEPGTTYELRMARIGVGDDVSSAGPQYVTKVSGRSGLVVEVRDRYDNPVSGVQVNATVERGNGTVEPAGGADGTTDGSGRASFRYGAAPDDERVVVNVSFGGGDAPRERTTFAFVVGDTGGGDGGSGSGGGDEPVREQFDIGDNSNDNHAKYGVNWAVSDPDGDLTRVTVELVDESSGTVVDSATYGADGSWIDRRSGTTFLQRKHGAGESYVLRLTAYDAEDHAVSWERSDVADGSDPD